ASAASRTATLSIGTAGGCWTNVTRVAGPKHVVEDTASAPPRCLDCRDVDLFHLHHGVEGAPGGSGIGVGDRFRQCDRRNLPRQSPLVLAPAARALLATVANDRVPVAIRFGLRLGCDLKRERLV